MSARELASIQAWMQHCILHPDVAAQGDEILAHLAPSSTLAPAARLAIHQRGYVARLLQCMEGQFKVLCKTLGHTLFADFATEYLRARPSQSPTLSDLGARFADYLEETRPDADHPDRPGAEREPWVDFLIALARHEWALAIAFDMEGSENLPPPGDATPDAALRLQPSARLYRHAFPVDTYHHAMTTNGSADVPAPRDTRLCVLRRDYRIGVFRLNAPQYEVLTRLGAGQPIDSALREVATKDNVTLDEAHASWRRWRARWLEQGFFVSQEIISGKSASRTNP